MGKIVFTLVTCKQERIGGGSEGCVFLAACKEYPDCEFAIKVFLADSAATDMREVEAVSSISFRNPHYILTHVCIFPCSILDSEDTAHTSSPWENPFQ